MVCLEIKIIGIVCQDKRYMSMLIVLWTVRVHEMCLVIRLIVIDVCA